LGKLFSAAFAPLAVVWALAESRIWLSIAVLAALGAAAALSGRPAIGMGMAAILAVLLMRADAILDAQKAARAA
jgi:hypothetical protein